MGKMMSLLEKYKLVEKDDTTENLDTQVSQSEMDEVNSHNILEAEDNVQVNGTQLQETDALVTDESSLTSSTHISIETTPSEETPSQTSEFYHELQNIDDIYRSYDLNDIPITQTAYHLENLIHALPNELPEYVKKTTVSNIITASAIDMQTLLNDGMTRYNSLNAFLETFTAVNMEEIATLKQEIEKLSAIIAGYHQEIKLKETLIQKEATIIETEEARLNSILTFFKN